MLCISRTFILALLGIFLVAATFVPAPVAANADLDGRVYFLRDGTGIAGAEVCLGVVDPNGDLICQDTTTTDTEGYYNFYDAPDQIYTIVITAVPPDVYNLVPSRREVAVPSAETSGLDFYVPVPHVWTKTEAIAHRGDRVTSPENTKTAVERAIEKGASYIEIDVVLAADDETVVISHGSNYKDEGPDVPTQVYGPTPDCFNRNLENDPNWAELLLICDIGSEMMIPIGDTWNPVFKDERFPTLAQVFQENTGFSGWMIELKKSEKSGLSDAEIAARNQLLGEKVQSLMETFNLDNGRNWVTSFEDSALAAVTNPGILKMRQVSVANTDIVGAVDNAIIRGYDALNLDLAAVDKTFVDSSTTWQQYVHSKGLLLSAYTLTQQEPQQHDNAISRKVDFFMTDILDDLLVKNGDRFPAHEPTMVYLRPSATDPTCSSELTNEEVFAITVKVRAFVGDTLLVNSYTDANGYFALDVPALGTLAAEYTPNLVQQTITYPDYGEEPNYDPTLISSSQSFPINNTTLIAAYLAGQVRLEIIAEHAEFPNVDPQFSLTSACGDDVTFWANGVNLSDESNPAIVGTTCVEADEPQVAQDVALSASLKVLSEEWGIITATLYLDGADQIGTYTTPDPSAPSQEISVPGSATLRDLEVGEHTLTLEYMVKHINDGTERTGTAQETFTVKLKPCLKNKDIMLVFDGSGSVSATDFEKMQSFGVRLVDGLEVSPSAANFGVVQFSSSVTTEIGLTDAADPVKSAINTMSKLGGGTNIDAGINEAQSEFNNGRIDAPNVIVLLTDGQGSGTSAAGAAKNAKTTIICIGIGTGVNTAELEAIASSPGSVFTPGDFEALIYVLQALLPAEEDPLP
ncbi:MAG: VWA domain-containing protein [Chloroflexaceae bacterium]